MFNLLNFRNRNVESAKTKAGIDSRLFKKTFLNEKFFQKLSIFTLNLFINKHTFQIAKIIFYNEKFSESKNTN